MTSTRTMGRGHFEFIAETLKACKPPFMGQTANEAAAAKAQWERMVARFAAELPRTCSGFKRDRFLRACGVDA